MNLFQYFTPKSETHYLDPNATIRQALEKFDYHKFSVVPLVDGEGKFVSTVSDGDILRYIKNCAGFDIAVAEKVCVSEIERYRPYRACRTDESIEELFRLALDQNFVPLIDDRGVYIGIIKRKTILRYLYEQHEGK